MKALFNAISRRVIASLALLASLVAGAADVDEARTLAEDGDIPGAVAMLRGIVASDSKDTEAALMLGQLLWDTGEDAEAVDVLESARSRGNREATLQLARIAMARYDIDDARELLAAYRKSLMKGKRQVVDDLSGNLEDQIDRAEGMLDRVQNIEVIDSVDVDAEEFFQTLSDLFRRRKPPGPGGVARGVRVRQPDDGTQDRER